MNTIKPISLYYIKALQASFHTLPAANNTHVLLPQELKTYTVLGKL